LDAFPEQVFESRPDGVLAAYSNLQKRHDDPRYHCDALLICFLMLLKKTSWDFRFHGQLSEDAGCPM
jgi:hypothetical protein